MAGGLRQLLASRGEDVQGLMQRAMVAVSLHEEQPGEAQGNKPGWMMVPLPLGEPDPVRRLELIAAETVGRKKFGSLLGSKNADASHAALRSYSWMRPPRTSRRQTFVPAPSARSPGSGGSRSRPR